MDSNNLILSSARNNPILAQLPNSTLLESQHPLNLPVRHALLIAHGQRLVDSQRIEELAPREVGVPDGEGFCMCGL